ncbi:hypothetical protein K1719_046915 [Acacia pycnantha]|nr:hypothetical protein K1719_046915 [Acacia pycnantha]
MAPPFVFPRTLLELEEDHDDDRLCVKNLVDASSLRASELEEFVKGVSFDLSDKELFCVEDQDVFDRVYSLIRGYGSLPPSCKLNIVESLRSNVSVLLPNVDSLLRATQGQGEEIPVLDRVASHRNAFKIYTYFLLNIVLAEESNSGSNNSLKVTASTHRKKQPVNSWNWEAQRGRILSLIANSLEINLELLLVRQTQMKIICLLLQKTCSLCLRNRCSLKILKQKMLYVVLLGLALQIADAEKKYADGSMAISLIRDIGRTNPKDYVRDTVGAENVGRFLVELADRLPKLISTNIGILIPHFGGESYKIRNALVGVLGKLIAKAFKDVEGEVSSKSIRLRTKQAMLEILLERCRDMSAYTRSRVLQVWAELCEEHCISIGLWNEVAAVAAGRLEDKSAIVRKSALNLLIMMLQHNPFGPQLRIASFEATLDQYKKRLNELEPDMPSEDVTDDLPSDGDNCLGDGEVDNLDPGPVAKEHQDSLTDSCMSQPGEVTALQDSNLPDVGNLEQTRALVASLESGLRFSKCICATMPTIVQLMASSSATDVENAILLLMRCRQFQIDGSEECLRKMLPLVFSQDKSIYEAVENAFNAIYIRKNPVETAKNLSSLVIDSNIGDLAALEFIVGALVSKGDLSSSTISALWDIFCFNISGTTAEQSRGALSVLCMVANSSAGVLGSHLQDIIDIGFGRWAKVDPLLARTASLAIQRLSDDDKKKLLVTSGDRIFGILESLITGSWLPGNIWYAAADKAIAAIYAIHPTPEAMAADMKQKIAKEKMDAENQSRDSNGTAPSGIRKDTDINQELEFDWNLLDLLSKLCRNFGLMQKYPELQASAMLALCRFMIIDAEFCDANLQLLFTVVESANSETVRSNCTIALGDLAVRFPNLLEPWTENMYARLRDPCVSVRKNAVLVLSHLILNDMMKVKGYINEMAVRLEDDDKRISSLAKLFFHELSKKGSNPIYNLLPDILSKLSNQNLTDDSFCNIMQFLIASIKKDKQMESLVEKLCNRFSGVTDVRQCENLSYCLSQLTFTERGMKKLIELFKTYEHALLEDSVMDHFRNIINKGKKFAKPELKSCIEEFEDKLQKFHMEIKEQEVAARNAHIHQQKIGSRVGFTSAIDAEDHAESNISTEEAGDEVIDPCTERIALSKNDKLKNQHVDSEEQSAISSKLTESDGGDIEVQSPLANKRGGTRSRTKKSTMMEGKGDNTGKRTTRARRKVILDEPED